MDIEEAIRIIKKGGEYRIKCNGDQVIVLEKISEKQFLATIEEFVELSIEAGIIDPAYINLP
ncbi:MULTISPECIES: hypothetical protein [Raoultella]|uniref:Uncharacterized protein n=2 Tax=Raoultella TaxID=160674 RepID=A0ABD7QN03_RAOOR|nr:MULTISPECIES: hypothetical protein [Raoultella]TCQ76252.1 hypothetical protein EC841_10161 [Raoultella ornithinolytica]QIT28540.1 hypothetical protein HCK03_11620 [Raoultella terrigena]SUQ57660.1 Uncharacterised protein [Raoultella terrigena]VFS74024.1 Uncharacterised protein [Raoultella terrigena]VTM11754.1 Uncharacterised protein [Raoultella terrigena]